MEALTADYSFLNADLARLYGLPEPAGEFEIVKFPADASARRHSRPGHVPRVDNRTRRDVSHRAWVVRARTPVVSDRAEPATRREYEPARAGNCRCRAREARAPARARDESLVLGLSSPDGSHRVRARKVRRRRRLAREGNRRRLCRRGRIAAEQAGAGRHHRRQAKSPGWPNSTFGDARALGRVLAASPVCQDCVVKQVFRYAFGRAEMPSDRAR